MIITAGDLYISQALTNISVATEVTDEGFVAQEVFPTVLVNKQSAKYWEYPRGAWFRSAAQVRGPGQESAGTSWQVLSKDAYYCNVQALHVDVDDFIRANADSVFSLDAEATRFCKGHIALKREYDFLSRAFVPGVWATDITPTIKWDQPNATPWKDIRTQMTLTRMKTGKRPNKLVIQEHVWDVLQDCPDILSRLTGGATTGDPAMATLENVAKVLGLQKIVVAGAIQNQGVEGQLDAFAFAPGQAALLVYAAPSPGIMTLSAGYTFVWNDLYGLDAQGERVAKFRMDPIRSDRIEAEGNWDHKVIGADLGVFFQNVLTP